MTNNIQHIMLNFISVGWITNHARDFFANMGGGISITEAITLLVTTLVGVSIVALNWFKIVEIRNKNKKG